ncbi:MAG: tetratricopeptide repeat protein [Zoogloea sp.]|nr:tetratricopeptide repeat protein [Zoogloea sp.]
MEDSSVTGLFGHFDLIAEAKKLFDAGKTRPCLAKLDEIPAMFAGDVQAQTLRAKCLQRLGQWSEAVALWEKLLADDPYLMEADVNLGYCRFQEGNVARAMEELKAAALRHPKHTGAQFNLIGAVLRTEGLGAAIARVRELGGRMDGTPDMTDLKIKILALHEPEEIKAKDPDDILGLRTESGAFAYNLRAIYGSFESIGCDCEFGFAQGKQKAEPLALLRWTSITPDNLVRLFGEKLSDYADPAIYRLEVSSSQEYIFKESKYNTASHTCLKVPEIGAEELLKTLCSRQAFLRRKFLEDAAKGEKVFVYKHASLSDSVMDEVQSAAAALGVRRMLFVRPADAENAGGTVRFVRPDRAVGFLSHFMGAGPIRYEEWDRIVINTYDYFQENASGQ